MTRVERDVEPKDHFVVPFVLVASTRVTIPAMSQGTLAKLPASPELTLDEWFALPEDEPDALWEEIDKFE